jgi:hypothetical protein
MAGLNSFGSVLTFAIDLETRLREYFQAAGLPDVAKEADKRRSTLERVRRENVVEITLEPIEGLDEADYAVKLDDHSAAGQAAVAEVAARFYRDVTPKINVRQAQRALERCGRQYETLAQA